MASTTPFKIVDSPAVASIPCLECGNNMRCVRRMTVSLGEYQQFVCSSCGATAERVYGEEASDNEIQREAERRSGVGRNVA